MDWSFDPAFGDRQNWEEISTINDPTFVKEKKDDSVYG